MTRSLVLAVYSLLNNFSALQADYNMSFLRQQRFQLSLSN